MFKFNKKPIKKNNIAIYTSIIGNIDNLIEPSFDIPGCDLILFTNRKDIKPQKYQIRNLENIYQNERLTSRAPKLLPHLFLPDYEYSLWIDGRVVLRDRNLGEYIKHMLSEKPWAMFEHTERDNIFDEAEVCIQQGKDDAVKINNQIDFYKQQGFKNQVRLMMGTIIFRKHMDPKVIRANEDWWYEITHRSIRDQLSFPYVAWKNELEINNIEGNPRSNKFFRILRYSQRDAFKTGEYKIKEAI